MFFWKRKKKEQDFEEKFQELDAAVLLENENKNTKKIEQYVVERLEQMIELTREIEEEKSEYRIVSSYLSDIQLLENLPEEEHRTIEEIASNVIQLNRARTEFLNSSKKLSDAQFRQMQQEEKEIPAAIKRLTANEMYQDTLKRDMKYLDREKSEWVLRSEYLEHQQKHLKNLLYIVVGMAATAAVLLGFLQLGFKVNCSVAWMILLFVTALAVCGIFLKIERDESEQSAAGRNINRAIVLQNKVKIKYVNVANAVDYACEKYHVTGAAELNKYWEYYMEAVKEHEKYQRTNEDLEYFNERLVKYLTKYKLYDAQVWVAQALALVDAKEMVEVKHSLVNRRQKLRGRMEYNLDVIKTQKREVEKLLNHVGDMRPHVEEILFTVNKLGEGI